MTVVGNGMLAKAFIAAEVQHHDLLIFCSGVSNSGTSSAREFEREKSLLLESLERYPDRKIIYFSSCAVGIIDSPYYQHKKAMEGFIPLHAQRYLIVRLPQVVGITKNSTLVSFIAANIKSGKPITVFSGARRNLIDVDDVVRLTLRLAKSDYRTINVTNSNMVSAEDIVCMISRILGKSPIMQAGPPEADFQDYDGGLLKELLGPGDAIYSADYNQTILSKYVPLLCG